MRLLIFTAFTLAFLYLLWLVPDFVIWAMFLLTSKINEGFALLGFDVRVDISWVAQLYSWVRSYAQVVPVAIVVLTALAVTFSIYER